MFSVKVTDGASRVADAQDLIADNNAPKNIICATSGAWLRINVGKIICGSPFSPIFAATISGSISKAEYARYTGIKANRKYRHPPNTEPHFAYCNVFADCARWKTSCCGIDPNIIVINAAAKAIIPTRSMLGQKLLNLPAADA